MGIVMLNGKQYNTVLKGFEEGGGGGSSDTPIFSETLLADDSSMTGTLDFNGVDYTTYPLLKVVLYLTDTQKEVEQLVVPSAITDAFQYFSRGICFDNYYSNRYAYYKPDSSGNWIKGNSDRIFCTKVYGLIGQNGTITVTNIYRGSSATSIEQTISYANKLSDFDCLVAICNASYNDCVPNNYVLICGKDNTPSQYFSNFANGWNNGREVFVSEHELSSYYWFSVDGIKFTPTTPVPKTPQFSETIICDNSVAQSTGTLTFTDDLENYDILDFECYNTSSQQITHYLTLPEVIVAIKSASSNYVNFNELFSNQYVCYGVSADNLTWSRYGSRNMIINKVTGYNCVNMTVVKTEFYKRNSISPVTALIEPVEDVCTYDYLFLASGDGAYDQTQPCADAIKIDKTFTTNNVGIFNRYNTYPYQVWIKPHSIRTIESYNDTYTNRYVFCAYGVKFI